MFGHIAIQYKHFQCFFELCIRLPKKRLAALKIIGQDYLREGLIELLEEYDLLAD